MKHRMNAEDKQQILEMYRCHFTPMETAKKVPFSYQSVIIYFRGFEVAGVKKYDRLNLIPGEINNDDRRNTINE